MKIIRIDHVSLNAHDRDATIAWYTDVLGLSAPGGATPPDQPVFVGAPQARLGLFADAAPGLRHIALATDRAGQAEVRERLTRLAVPWRGERHSDHESVYFADPDGVTVEVMVSIP